MERMRFVLVAVLMMAGADAGGAQAPDNDPLPHGAALRLGSTRWRCVHGVRCAAFSPDGKHFAILGDDGVPRLWDATTGRELHAFDHTHGACLAFSPDGQFLALPGKAEQRAVLFDVRTRQVVRPFTEPIPPDQMFYRPVIAGMAFSPDGK